jgi:hypothetical protein
MRAAQVSVAGPGLDGGEIAGQPRCPPSCPIEWGDDTIDPALLPNARGVALAVVVLADGQLAYANRDIVYGDGAPLRQVRYCLGQNLSQPPCHNRRIRVGQA